MKPTFVSKKGNNCYRIGHRPKWNPEANNSKEGKSVIVVDRGESLLFLPKPGDSFYSLKHKNGKVYLYRMFRGTIRDSSARAATELRWIVQNNATRVRIRKPIRLSDFSGDNCVSQDTVTRFGTEEGDVCPSVLRRLNSLVGEFAKRHSLTFAEGHTEEETFRNLQRLVFPSLRDSEINIIHSSTGFLLREQSLSQAITRAFGTNGKKTKRLAFDYLKEYKATCVLNMAVILRGLVSLDFIQAILEHPRFITAFRPNPVKPVYCRKLFKEFRPSHLKRILENSLDAALRESYLHDSVRMYWQWREQNREIRFDFERINNLHDLHTHFSGIQHKIVHKNQEIKYSDNELKLDGLPCGKFTIQLPKDTNTLVDWGLRMHNCIGSYTGSAVGKTSLFFGVFDQDKLLYNGQINGKHLVQLLGFANKKVDSLDYEAMQNGLVSLGIAENPRYYGPRP